MISVAYIESDLHTALMVCLFCQRHGRITIHAFFTGYDALETHSYSPVGNILSVYDMPGMTGIELLAALQSLGDPAPFILFTDTGDITKILNAVNRYPAARIFTRENLINGQFSRLVMMIRSVAQHPVVRIDDRM